MDQDRERSCLYFPRANDCSEPYLHNRFPDYGEEPEYNTVDATLWFFNATYEYYKYTGDLEFIKNDLLDVLEDSINWHLRGTFHNIHMDVDGLLSSGEHGQQLTWMDAKCDDWVVTPREGKVVEILGLVQFGAE